MYFLQWIMLKYLLFIWIIVVYIEQNHSGRQTKTSVCFCKRIHRSESPYGVLDAGVQQLALTCRREHMVLVIG